MEWKWLVSFEELCQPSDEKTCSSQCKNNQDITRPAITVNVSEFQILLGQWKKHIYVVSKCCVPSYVEHKDVRDIPENLRRLQNSVKIFFFFFVHYQVGLLAAKRAVIIAAIVWRVLLMKWLTFVRYIKVLTTAKKDNQKSINCKNPKAKHVRSIKMNCIWH